MPIPCSIKRSTFIFPKLREPDAAIFFPSLLQTYPGFTPGSSTALELAEKFAINNKGDGVLIFAGR